MPIKFRILGSGEWGLAIGNHLSWNNYDVEIFGRTKSKIDNLIKSRKYSALNLKFLNNVTFKYLDDINYDGDEVYNIIATSSSGFADCINYHRDYLMLYENICWLTKGIDSHSCRLFDEVVYDTLGDQLNVGILSGPSFARDLVLRKNMSVSLATSNNSFGDELSACLNSSFFHIEHTSDLIGVQVSGIMKNIAAILSGMLSASNFPKSDLSTLIDITKDEILQITTIIYEQRKIKINGSILVKTLASPSCDGDLKLSCLEDHSRNRTFGLNWVTEKNVDTLSKRIGTIEGYNSVIALSNLIKPADVGPVLKSVYDILFNDTRLEDTEIIKNL